MKVDYTLQEIRSALNAWTELVTPVVIDRIPSVNQDLIIKFLNQGFCILITEEDYKKWNSSNPDFIHAYPALFGDELKFVLIDSNADQNRQTGIENIVVKDFMNGEPGSSVTSNVIPSSNSIGLAEALRRNFTWKMFCRNWLQACVGNPSNPIFKCICIPFRDCVGVFFPNNSEIVSEQHAFAFLGLRKQEINQELYEIEFILTHGSANYHLPGALFDISRPVPPFASGGGLDAAKFKMLPNIG